MKKLMVCLTILMFLVSGCGGYVDTTDIIKAEVFCKDKGGVKEINNLGVDQAWCMNGEVKSLSIIKITKDDVIEYMGRSLNDKAM